ncbi:hypothetical protein H4J59_11125 [Colwellia sp. MB02u-10]|uniref:hypothetical protein n=1 Tax=Colwellia sp. MB02u-10 TaxID=2759828 RepID=UPI0015F4C12A|nr:hypothetical protein [Colwellia sp. MB02u-10]MBA6341538.1 hypothetical protein [Colwellia sp. MB02u-10]
MTNWLTNWIYINSLVLPNHIISMKMMIFNQYVMKRVKATLFGVTCALAASAVNASTVSGASLNNAQQIYAEAIVKFAELNTKYYDRDVPFGLLLDGELGVKKDRITDLKQGLATHYTIIAPWVMAGFTPAIALTDMSFWVILTAGNNDNE